MKGLTIFSLVKQEKLSHLFEIVAKALRRDAAEASSAGTNTSEPPDSSSVSTESRKWDYAAMTLPCIDFPSSREQAAGKGLVNPLYITVSTLRNFTSALKSCCLMMLSFLVQVTLMGDEDPRKRLFHCVFTDCPGTNGSLGSITPELLAMLFTRQRKPEIESRRSEKST